MRRLLIGSWLRLWKLSAQALAVCPLLLTTEQALADQTLTITPKVIANLRSLKAELNFEPDDKTYYTGVADSSVRMASGEAFSSLVKELVVQLPEHPSKQFVLSQFKITLDRLLLSDTEDRERAATYCEKIMDVLGIQSSDGLLNDWMYGPVLGHMVNKKAHEQ
jgi:hypothetical protein